MRFKGALVLTSTLALLSLVAGTSLAHGARIAASVEGGNRIRGSFFYVDDSPVIGGTVRLFSGDQLLGEAKTSRDGTFEMALPPALSGSFRLVADDGMGHRATAKLVLSSPEGEGGQSVPATQQDLEALLERKLSPIRESLERLERASLRPDSRAIFGGIGYIFGLMGMLYGMLRRR